MQATAEWLDTNYYDVLGVAEDATKNRRIASSLAPLTPMQTPTTPTQMFASPTSPKRTKCSVPRTLGSSTTRCGCRRNAHGSMLASASGPEGPKTGPVSPT